MLPSGSFQKYDLAGKGAYSQQLQHISLVDAHDGTFVGINSGTAITNSPINARNTAIGANTAVTSRTISNSTLVGAYCGERIQNAESITSIGAGSLQFGSNVVGTTVLGYECASELEKSSFDTVVGYKAFGQSRSGSKNVSLGALSGYYAEATNCVFAGESSGKNARNCGDSVFVGSRSGAGAPSSNQNVFVGASSGEFASNSQDNCYVGFSTGRYNNLGSNCVFLGAFAGSNVSNISDTIMIGSQSGGNSANVGDSVIIGKNACSSLVSGNELVVIGAYAAKRMTKGSRDVILGFSAGRYADNVDESIFVGYEAGNASTSDRSVFVGSKTGATAHGNLNVFVGFAAGEAVTNSEQTTCVGSFAGNAITTGNNNTIIGAMAGNGITFESDNTMLGYTCGNSGAENCVFGIDAGSFSTGNQNSIFGKSAGRINGGNQNVFFGFRSGAVVTGGEKNTSIGAFSSSRLRTGNYNTHVGYLSGTAEPSSNTVCVGPETGKGLIGNDHVILGTSAGYGVTASDGCILIGTWSGANTINTIDSSVSIGRKALKEHVGNATPGIGGHMMALGDSACRNSNCDYTTGIGYQAGFNTTASYSSFVGISSGNNSVGSNIICMGATSGTNSNCVSSIFIGIDSGENGIGSNIVCIGTNSGGNIISNNSVFIGPLSGKISLSGENNVGIGVSAMEKSLGASNCIVIGTSSGTFLNAEDSVYLGARCGTSSYGRDNICIGRETGIGAAGNVIAIGYDIVTPPDSQNYTVIGRKLVIGTAVPCSNVLVLGENCVIFGVGRETADSVVVGLSCEMSSLTDSSVFGGNIQIQKNCSGSTFIGQGLSIGNSSNSSVVLGRNIATRSLNSMVLGEDCNVSFVNDAVVIGSNVVMNSITNGLFIGRNVNGTDVSNVVLITNSEGDIVVNATKDEMTLGGNSMSRVVLTSNGIRVRDVRNLCFANTLSADTNVVQLSGVGNTRATDVCGFGLGASTTRYNTTSGGSHKFYANTTLLANIDSSGNFMISGATAQKLTGTTWVTPSDRRIKRSIKVANIEACADVVRTLDLKSYDVFDKTNVLGWVAQEVEPHFPESVTETVKYGYDDLKMLDVDQIHANSYGALKWALQRIDALEKKIEKLTRTS